MSGGPPRRARRRRRRARPATTSVAQLERRRRSLGRLTLALGVAVAIAAILVSRLGLLSGVVSDEVAQDVTIRPPVIDLRHAVPASLTLVDVEDVIDGDTLDVRAAQTEMRVRVFGIDAPEPGEPCADEATQRLAELAGTQVRLRPDERLQDPFGRALRYLYTPDGFSIDATLVAEGLARAWTEDGALRDELVALEQRARSNETGCLWE